MKNRTTMIVALALFALVVATLPAGAKPPEGKGKPGPSDDTALGGTMCDPAEYPRDIEYVDGALNPEDGVWEDNFTFTLSGKSESVCVDVISEKGPWEVSITGQGARSLLIIPRDSWAPGDSCGGWILRNTIYDNERGDEPLILGYDDGAGQSVPRATVNACGTDFAEWVDADLVNGPDDDLCVVYDVDEDLCLVEAKLPNVTHPLVLLVGHRGSANGVTTISVDLPPIAP